MAISKEPQANPVGRRASVGLLALGTSGSWEIAINQTTTGPDRWYAQFEGPSVYLYFKIPSVQIVTEAIEFLTCVRAEADKNATPATCPSTLPLGTSTATPVTLVRDDEFSDRFFLVIEPKHGPLVRFTLAGDDLAQVIDALCQCKDDLA